MGKGIATLNREIRKREFEETPLGQAQKKLKQFYGDADNEGRFDEESSKWVVEHRDTTQFRQEALEDSHKKALEELNDKYAKMMDELLVDAVTTELNYVTNLPWPSN